jgi:zinc transporter ZupT
MSKTFAVCVLVFLAALYVVFNVHFDFDVRVIASGVAFVIACAAIGAFFGELCGGSFTSTVNQYEKPRIHDKKDPK